MKSPLRLLLCATALAAGASILRAEDSPAPVAASDDGEKTTVTRIAFSDPARPGTVRVMIPWADIKVTGSDTKEVTVQSTLAEKNRQARTENGLRRLDEEVSFEVTEKDNVVTVELAGGGGSWHGHGAEFELTVPRNTLLSLNNEMGGDIIVENVEGDIDISSMNGEIRLTGIAGSAIVNSMNGEITAEFKAAPVKPVHISSMNGEINVRLPVATKASVRMRTHNGSILTDFPETVLAAKSESVSGAVAVGRARSEAAREAAEAVRVAAEVARSVAEEVRKEIEHSVAEAEGRPPRAPRAPRPPSAGMFGGKSIVGTLNGGGCDISLTSMNGTITLRQAK